MSNRALAQINDIDTELSNVASKLATQIKDQGKKKVAVIDFTDLEGGASELGRYVSEQLTVDLVMDRKDFSVLDRANLQKILAEHKLTATGLVDPDNAKKLGQFAGVDALILGTVTPKNQSVGLTAKIITTDTAEIVGATKGEFKADSNVEGLLTHTNAETASSDSPAKTPKADLTDDKPKVVKSLGDLRVEMQPLQIVNGSHYLLTMTLTNQSPKKSIWVALSTDMGSNVKGAVTDAGGSEFRGEWNSVSGIAFAASQNGGFFRATEIRPNDSVMATVKFGSYFNRQISPGNCRLQLEFLIGHNFNGSFGAATEENLVTQIPAN